MYTRSSARITPAAGVALRGVVQVTFDTGSVIGFKGNQAGVEQLTPRNDDHVETRRNLVPPKHFTDEPFCPIPLDRPANLPRGGDTKPADVATVRHDEDRAEPTRDTRAALVNGLELRAAANPLDRTESRDQLLVAHSQPLAPFRAAALQHEAAILRAHPDQEPMRPFAPTRVGLEGALSLHRNSRESWSSSSLP